MNPLVMTLRWLGVMSIGESSWVLARAFVVEEVVTDVCCHNSSLSSLFVVAAIDL